MKVKYLFLSFVFALILCSCNREKDFSIVGTINLPAQIPYGDTIIDVPSFEGTWVYMLSLENEPIDSVQIKDNAFHFEGKVKAKEPYYVQLATHMGNSLLVIEPGEIDVEVTEQGLDVSGTPSNDAMCDIDALMENLNADTYAYYSHVVDSLQKIGAEMTEAEQMQMAKDFQNTMTRQLDSCYQANKDNLGAAYAVLMLHMDSESSDAFEKAIADYPEEIQKNELIQFNLKMLRQYEAMYDSTQELIPDSLSLQPEELASPSK